jgi:hypothetical protein
MNIGLCFAHAQRFSDVVVAPKITVIQARVIGAGVRSGYKVASQAAGGVDGVGFDEARLGHAQILTIKEAANTPLDSVFPLTRSGGMATSCRPKRSD